MTEAEEIASAIKHLVPEAECLALGCIASASLRGRAAHVYPPIMWSREPRGRRVFLHGPRGLMGDHDGLSAFLAIQMAARWLLEAASA